MAFQVKQVYHNPKGLVTLPGPDRKLKESQFYTQNFGTVGNELITVNKIHFITMDGTRDMRGT